MCLSRVMIGVLPGHKISHRMFGQHNLFVRKKQHEEKDLQLFFLVHSFLIKYWTKLRNKPTEKSFLWGILLSDKETFCCFGCLIIFLLLLLLLLLFSIFSRVRNVRKHRMPKAKREHKKNPQKFLFVGEFGWNCTWRTNMCRLSSRESPRNGITWFQKKPVDNLSSFKAVRDTYY